MPLTFQQSNQPSSGASYASRGPAASGFTGAPSQADLVEQGAQQKIAQTQANAQMYPATLQQQRFNQIFPYLQSQLSNNQNPYTIGGPAPLGPNISAAPVLNSQQIQQQVNTQNAAADQSTAGNIRNMQQSAAGRGIGANSPLSQALAGQAQSANLAGKTANETQTRLGAAQANAGQVLQGQQAQQAQFAQQQQSEIARAAPYFQQRNILLQALAGLV